MARLLVLALLVLFTGSVYALNTDRLELAAEPAPAVAPDCELDCHAVFDAGEPELTVCLAACR